MNRPPSATQSLRASLTIVVLALLSAATPTFPQAAQDAPSGWLGVLFGSDRISDQDPGSDKIAEGVRIRGVVEDSPAARAGLRARDRVVAVDTTRLSSPQDLAAAIGRMEPGRWVSVTVERGDEQMHFDTRLTERPAESEMNRLRVRQGWIGVEAIDLPETLRRHFGAPEGAGVMISDVIPASPGEAAGLDLGDIVFDVDGAAIATEKDLRIAVAMGGVGNTLEITLMRNGSEITVDATIVTLPEPKEVEPKS